VSSQPEITALWTQLADLPRPTLAELFAKDEARVDTLTGRIELGEEQGGIRFDWSKTHLDAAHLGLFEKLAAAVDFDGQRKALFAARRSTSPRAALPSIPPSAAWAATPAWKRPWRSTPA
jgi:glucose-6-phosphate isomerase